MSSRKHTLDAGDDRRPAKRHRKEASALVPMTQPQQASPLLNLPTELILMTAKHLELHDQFLLAQVSPRLRNIFGRNWRQITLELSHAERITFWRGISYRRQELWTCRVCCSLHRANLDQERYTSLRSSAFGAFGCLSRRPGPVSSRGSPFYAHEAAIQLALKVHRIDVTPIYLERLFHHFQQSCRIWPEAHVRTIPKIISGRFVAQVEWLFGASSYDRNRSIPNLKPISRRGICSHLRYYSREYIYMFSEASAVGTWEVGSPRFQNDITLATEPAMMGHEVSGGCICCPMDYSITATPGQVLLVGWFDLGGEEEPIWKADGGSVGRPDGFPRRYIPGMVRRMFNDEE